MTPTLDKRPDFVLRLAAALSKAWSRYNWLFGEPPHGTEKQLAAMLELGAREWLQERDKRLADYARSYEGRGVTVEWLLTNFEKSEQNTLVKATGKTQ